MAFAVGFVAFKCLQIKREVLYFIQQYTHYVKCQDHEQL